jgi:hypothetical protein
VLCDFGQLLPDRTANVAVSEDGRVVQIDIAGFEPEQSGVSLKIDKLSGRNGVEVAVEMRDAGNPDPDMGWLPARTVKIAAAGGLPSVFSGFFSGFGPLAAAGSRPGASPVLWSGTITMPEPIGSGKYRIVVREFEFYYDDDSQETDPKTGVATRLVYADTIDL